VPALVDNTIYVGSDGYYSIYALDAGRGTVLWHTTNLATIISRPAVGDGLVFVAAIDQKVSALDLQTGKLVWSFQTEGNGAQPPLPTGAAVTVSGSVLYVGGQGGVLYALDATSGRMLWQRTLDSAIDSAPTVVDGAVYVASDSGTVYAFRASDGAPAWSYRSTGSIYASPVIAP
jgi:serine/threonine-protein kinase